MTYPFAGEIKMTKVIKDGKEVIEWEEVKWDASAPLIMGVECMRLSMTDGLEITPGNGVEFMFTKPATEWARVDKDLNVTHLDMDLCRKGQQNEYTALAIAIWDAATKAAQKEWQGLTDEEIIKVIHPLVIADIADEATDYEIARAIEAKLKEKNT